MSAQPKPVDTFLHNADECAKFDAPFAVLRLTPSQLTALFILWAYGRGAELIEYTHKALAAFGGQPAEFFDEHLPAAYQQMAEQNLPLFKQVQRGLFVPLTGYFRPSIADTTLMRQVQDEIESERPVNPLARVQIATGVLRAYGAVLPEPEPEPGETRAQGKVRARRIPTAPHALNLILRLAGDIVTRANQDPGVDDVALLAHATTALQALLDQQRRVRQEQIEGSATVISPAAEPSPSATVISPVAEPSPSATVNSPASPDLLPTVISAAVISPVAEPSPDSDANVDDSQEESQRGIGWPSTADNLTVEGTGIHPPSESPSPSGSPLLSSIAERIADARRFADLLSDAGVRSVQVMMKDDVAGRIVDDTYETLDVFRAALPGYLEVSDDFHLSLIVRTAGGECVATPGAVQIDDCTAEERDRYAPLAFAVLETSPGNWQDWLKLDDVDEDEARDIRSRFFERAKGAGERANYGASGAVRLPGSRNFKPEHGPDFPVIRLVGEGPGRTVTVAELESMGLLAPEPETPLVVDFAVWDEPSTFPDYDNCLGRAGAKTNGKGADRNVADLIWCQDALEMGHRTKERIAETLASLSGKAKEHGKNRYRYAEDKVLFVAKKHGYQLRD